MCLRATRYDSCNTLTISSVRGQSLSCIVSLVVDPVSLSALCLQLSRNRKIVETSNLVETWR